MLTLNDPLSRIMHDLRQPLANIAFSASYLEMILEPGDTQVMEQVAMIQAQLERASHLLDEASRIAHGVAAPQAQEPASLERTNSATSALT